MALRLIGSADHPQHITTTVTAHSRLFNSRSGNPRYTLMTDNGTFSTDKDSAFAYGLTNSENLGDDITITTRPRRVVLHLDKANAVHGMTFLDDAAWGIEL